jgi:hydroxypyruvate isomerase
MAILKQSFCYPMYVSKDVPLALVIKRAAQIGYAAVELWGRENAPFDELCDLAAKYDIAVASMCGHNSLRDGLNKRENHNRIYDELCKSIEIAKTRRIPGIICFSGNRYDGVNDALGMDICVEGLNKVKGDAEKAGINLNIELLNSKVDHKGYQCDTSAWAFEMLRRVNSPNVKALYDIYHMQIMEGDIIRTIRDNIALIGHFHTAGNPGRLDFDDDQELNYTGICKAIVQTGYSLYVGHEFKPKIDPLAALERAYQRCIAGL